MRWQIDIYDDSMDGSTYFNHTKQKRSSAIQGYNNSVSILLLSGLIICILHQVSYVRYKISGISHKYICVHYAYELWLWTPPKSLVDSGVKLSKKQKAQSARQKLPDRTIKTNPGWPFNDLRIWNRIGGKEGKEIKDLVCHSSNNQ